MPSTDDRIAMKHLPLRECGYAIGVVVLLAAVYVGAYYAMVGRDYDPNRWVVGACDDCVHAQYPTEHLRAFFAPIHQVDRKARARFWSEDGFVNDLALDISRRQLARP